MAEKGNHTQVLVPKANKRADLKKAKKAHKKTVMEEMIRKVIR